jgi:hypothetical protein
MRVRIARPLTTAVIALAVALTLVAPASAIVRFEPSPEPVPDRWAPETPVAVTWAGVSIRVPPSWQAKVKPEPSFGVESGASLLVAFGPGDSMLTVHAFDPARVQTWQDVGIEPAAELTIDGHATERFDDMLGTGAPISSAYSVHANGYVYSLLFHAQQAPADRWLSIAETLRLPGSG